MNHFLFLSLALLSCQTPPAKEVPEELVIASAVIPAALDCRVPGAIPGDGLDDLPAIQNALKTNGCADLGPGVFNISIPASPRAIGMLNLTSGQSLRGIGPGTVLKFSGDAKGHDWAGVSFTSGDNSLSSLTLDTTNLIGTSEQTHAAQILGPVNHASIHDVWFIHPQRFVNTVNTLTTNLPGGDCIKVIGYDANKHISLNISNNHFVLCDRSGVSVHGGVYGMVLHGNIFYDTGDTDIDVESSDGNGEWSITGNVTLLGHAPQGGVSVSLSGPLVDSITFSDNVLFGRGLGLEGAKRTVVANNVIVRSFGAAADPVLGLTKTNTDVIVANNVLSRELSAGPGAILGIIHHGTGYSGHVLLSQNLISQATLEKAIDAQSVSDLIVFGNRIEFIGNASGLIPAISVVGVINRTESLLVSGNFFKGAWKEALMISNSYTGGIGAVSVTNNIGVGLVSFGIWCQFSTSGLAYGKIVSSGNNWMPNSMQNGCFVPTAGN